MGKKLADLGLTTEVKVAHHAVKEAVFPFDRFDNVDTLLGPEMKSTGEVMGLADSVGIAFAKSQLAAGQKIPALGNVFISVRDRDKPAIIPIAKELIGMGFMILATGGTAKYLSEQNLDCTRINKISEGRPHIHDKIRDKDIQWIVNTSMGNRTTEDSYIIRRAALDFHLPYTTTIAGAQAMTMAITATRQSELEVKSVQEYFI
jgi:carbamoyl-phosphate synthase large subunit